MAVSSLSASSNLQTSFTLNQTNTGLNPTTTSQSFQAGITWSFGTGAQQIKEVYCAVRTLAASTSETLDLFGVLVGFFNETLNFTSIKEITITLLSTPTASSSITVGGGASHPFVWSLGGTLPTITITSNDYYSQSRSDATGWVVTSGSIENMKVTNNDGANAAVYIICLKGTV